MSKKGTDRVHGLSTAAVCRIAPMVMTTLPMIMHTLRPNLSLTYGTSGTAHAAPIEKAAVITPRSAPLGLLKSRKRSTQVCIERKIRPLTVLPGLHSLKSVEHTSIVP